MCYTMSRFTHGLWILLTICMLWKVVNSSCLGTRCLCYEVMARVDCDNGLVDLIPGIVKRATEILNLEHVIEGSLDDLDITHHWPSLKKLTFNVGAPYECAWLHEAMLPETIEIISNCNDTLTNDYELQDVKDVHTSSTHQPKWTTTGRVKISEVTSSELEMPGRGRGNLLKFLTARFVHGMNTTNSTPTEGYSVDIKITRGNLIVTIVLPITFIVGASLVLVFKWNRSTPSRISLDYHLRQVPVMPKKPRKPKAPRSPPPEAASLMHTYAFDHTGYTRSPLKHSGKLI